MPSLLQMMQVAVPPGVSAGQTIMIATPAGQQLQVAVPAGVGPGQSFQVAVPAPGQPPQAVAAITLPVAAPSACGSCGKANDGGGKFCAGCGGKMIDDAGIAAV